MAKNEGFDSFLSETGRIIFTALEEHCKALKMMDADTFELSMLANSFDLYAINARICNESGVGQNPKDGGWAQVRPEYTVMKNEYQNILKHSAKFGLNPGDREKIFKGDIGKKGNKKAFDK